MGETRDQRADVEKQRAAEAVETPKGTEGSSRGLGHATAPLPQGTHRKSSGSLQAGAAIFTLDGDIRFSDSVSWKSEARAMRKGVPVWLPAVATAAGQDIRTRTPGSPRSPRAPGSPAPVSPWRSMGHQGSVRGTGGGQRVTGGGRELEGMTGQWRLEEGTSQRRLEWGTGQQRLERRTGQWRLERGTGQRRLEWGAGQRRLERGASQWRLEGRTGQRRLEAAVQQRASSIITSTLSPLSPGAPGAPCGQRDEISLWLSPQLSPQHTAIRDMGHWGIPLTADPGGPGGPKGPGAPSLPGAPARPYGKNEAREGKGDWGTFLPCCSPKTRSPLGRAGSPPLPHPQPDPEVLGPPSPHTQPLAPLPALHWGPVAPALLEGLSDQGTPQYQEVQGVRGALSLPGTEIAKGGMAPAGPLPRTSP